MSIPKVFVGTLYCGEGDFEFCVKAVNTQQYVNVTHHIIKYLPEIEAHNALWQSWREVKNDYDLFVKVDADTVLAHNNILKIICDIFEQDKDVTGLQAPLFDFFTGTNINGLNCFSPKVTFLDSKDNLFCDRKVDVGHNKVLKSNNVPDTLCPAGYHCFGATHEQAFHFGVHRALKKQTDVLLNVRKSWEKYKDKTRAYVLLGEKFANQFGGNFNYNDNQFKEVFNHVQNNYESLFRSL